jgi:uncharacterized protein
MDAAHPLDGSAVHPEAYPVAERIAQKTGRPLKSLIGDKAFLSKLRPQDFADETFGAPTVTDILSELEKPGRDPRPQFQTAAFDDAIHSLSDLKPGQRLEGVVTNVTAFGAFVDIGVHQDGLVHISELADTFVKDPHSVVRAGQVVRVVVKDVDAARKRIALSMKSGSGAASAAGPAPRPSASAAKPMAARAAPDRPSASPFDVLKTLDMSKDRGQGRV